MLLANHRIEELEKQLQKAIANEDRARAMFENERRRVKTLQSALQQEVVGQPCLQIYVVVYKSALQCRQVDKRRQWSKSMKYTIAAARTNANQLRCPSTHCLSHAQLDRPQSLAATLSWCFINTRAFIVSS